MSFDSINDNTSTRSLPDLYRYDGSPAGSTTDRQHSTMCNCSGSVAHNDRPCQDEQSREYERIRDWRPDYSLSSEQSREWYRQSQLSRKQPLELNGDGTYTVQHADCLETIAERELRKEGKSTGRQAIDGEVQKLIALNRDRYATMDVNSEYTRDGWKLRLTDDRDCHRRQREDTRQNAHKYRDCRDQAALSSGKAAHDRSRYTEYNRREDAGCGKERSDAYKDCKHDSRDRGRGAGEALRDTLRYLPPLLSALNARNYDRPCNGYGYRGPGYFDYGSAQYYPPAYGYGSNPAGNYYAARQSQFYEAPGHRHRHRYW